MKYNIIHDKIKCTSHLSLGKIDIMRPHGSGYSVLRDSFKNYR